MKVKLVRIHRNHYTVIIPNVTPIKRLWQACVPFGQESKRDPKQECIDWCAKNNYEIGE